jgi:drug/metabolite transporter (DMT)-like permease
MNGDQFGNSRMATVETTEAHSTTQGRLLILLAAVLWSLNGFFNTVLRSETFLHLNVPEVKPMHIAFYRALFAGLVIVPSLRWRNIRFRRPMLFTAAAFAIMNVLFVTAMAGGKTNVAKALFLQYTAPAWMYLACVLWLKEPANTRNMLSVFIALIGVAVIVWGGWQDSQLLVVLIALGSGVAYAVVLIGLRVMCHESSAWLTVLNFAVSAIALLPIIIFIAPPTWPQMLCLLIYGGVQLGIPYWLMARGLRSVSPQEAGMLTLVEPLLAPLWVYLTATQRKVPDVTDWIGGPFILAALVWRYAPALWREKQRARSASEG